MKELEFRDWEHLKEFISDSFRDSTRYIFRGHADRNWKLESTLTRLFKNITLDLDSEQIEKIQLNNFRKRIRGLRGANPAPLTDTEIWSLGQHYGLATPLLDWTYSPFIATYFAFESKDSCKSEWRSIFVLDYLSLQTQEDELWLDGFELVDPNQDDNNRIIAQAGLFTLFPTNTDLSTWLEKKGVGDSLLKLSIEDDYRLDVINDLHLMNIVGSTVYPDLHGASLACNMWLERLSENHELNKKAQQLMKALGINH